MALQSPLISYATTLRCTAVTFRPFGTCQFAIMSYGLNKKNRVNVFIYNAVLVVTCECDNCNNNVDIFNLFSLQTYRIFITFINNIN